MRYSIVCIRCYQSTAQPLGELSLSKPPVPFVCGACREQDRKPQGQVVKLFEPAPNQIPGQLNF